MQFQWHLTTFLFSYLATAAPLLPRSASFPSLLGLTHLTQDHSKPDPPTHPGKFFHEATFDRHYDGRFADQTLPSDLRHFHLRLLLKSYMDTMDRIGVKTWLVHGALLGWFWNGQIMPWDANVDVSVDERSIRELGTWYNMTVHHFYADDFGLSDLHGEGEEVGGTRAHRSAGRDMSEFGIPRSGKKYLLEVNPNYDSVSPLDKANIIDARWIDTSTGLYIDITTVHPMREEYRALLTQNKNANKNKDPPKASHSSTTAATEEDTSGLYTKDKHIYPTSHLFPLRSTTFEGTPVNVPYAYEAVLREEFGVRALTNMGFDAERKVWVKMEGDEVQQRVIGERGEGR